jgi:hypothetical protein
LLPKKILGEPVSSAFGPLNVNPPEAVAWLPVTACDVVELLLPKLNTGVALNAVLLVAGDSNFEFTNPSKTALLEDCCSCGCVEDAPKLFVLEKNLEALPLSFALICSAALPNDGTIEIPLFGLLGTGDVKLLLKTFVIELLAAGVAVLFVKDELISGFANPFDPKTFGVELGEL